jgi:hypothetical protein
VAAFEPFCTLLRTSWFAGLDRADFDRDAFRNQVYGACVAVLESLEREGFFGGPDRDEVVVFAVSDDEDPARDRRWIHRLNPPRLARQ